MSSVAQIEANRSNAQLSSGPATSAGLARSARNARTHGITMNIANLEGEELASYNELLQALIAEFQPKGALEHRCVREMAAAEWRLESIATRQQSLIMGDLDQNARALSLLLRYESAARRAFERANATFRQNRIKPLPVEFVRRRLSAEEREARLEQLFGKTELSRIRGEEVTRRGATEKQTQFHSPPALTTPSAAPLSSLFMTDIENTHTRSVSICSLLPRIQRDDTLNGAR